MSTITAAMVKDLREQTGAGMMDCKQALSDNNGDMEAAVDWLRKKGLSKAAKKSGRVAADGLIAVASGDKVGAVVEVNSETDFVARNDQFQAMVLEVAGLALEHGDDVSTLAAATYPGESRSVEDQLKEMVGTIGENMTLRRSAKLSVDAGVVATYVHNKVVDGAGKIGVLVALESSGDTAKLDALGRQLAMHIAALAPVALTAEDVPAEIIEKEREIVLERERAADPDRPQEHLMKRVDKLVGKEFYDQVVLLQQKFVMDQKKTVAAVLKDAENDVGAPVEIKAFERIMLGEGIDKQETDFAAEVAAAAGA